MEQTRDGEKKVGHLGINRKGLYVEFFINVECRKDDSSRLDTSRWASKKMCVLLFVFFSCILNEVLNKAVARVINRRSLFLENEIE